MMKTVTDDAGPDALRGALARCGRAQWQQIIGFWGAWFGWMLDGMDGVIYALVLAPGAD